MIEPGVHDLTRAEYDADPCPIPSLSSSIAKVMVNQSARHAWLKHPRLNPDFERSDDRKFDLGTGAHQFILGGDGAFRLIDAADYKTKAARETRDEAIANGFVPMLVHQFEQVRQLGFAARAQLEHHEEASEAFKNGTPEQTLVWQESEHVWCRARLDWLPLAGPFYDDLKTTGASANPDEWARTMFNMGADMQAAIYLRGIRALGLHDNPQFRFVVVENTPPYALSVIGLSPVALAVGEMKVKRAIDYWSWCIQNSAWPGYPKRTAYVDAPPWEENKIEAMKLRDDIAREQGEDMKEAMLLWQSPDQEAA